MDGRSLAETLLKVWGVILLLGAFADLPAQVLMASATVEPDSQAALIRSAQSASMLALGVSATLGLCLILWGAAIARSIVPEAPRTEVGLQGPQLLAVGLALVGAFALIDGRQELGAVAYVLLTKPEWDETGSMSYVWSRQAEAMVRALVQLIAGAILVLGRDAITRTWARLRGSESAG